jgi:hypothetical protein
MEAGPHRHTATSVRMAGGDPRSNAGVRLDQSAIRGIVGQSMRPPIHRQLAVRAGWRRRRVRAFAGSPSCVWRVGRDRRWMAAGAAGRCTGLRGEMPGSASAPRMMPIRAVSNTILTLMGPAPAIHDFAARNWKSRGCRPEPAPGHLSRGRHDGVGATAAPDDALIPTRLTFDVPAPAVSRALCGLVLFPGSGLIPLRRELTPPPEPSACGSSDPLPRIGKLGSRRSGHAAHTHCPAARRQLP